MKRMNCIDCGCKLDFNSNGRRLRCLPCRYANERMLAREKYRNERESAGLKYSRFGREKKNDCITIPDLIARMKECQVTVVRLATKAGVCHQTVVLARAGGAIRRYNAEAIEGALKIM